MDDEINLREYIDVIFKRWVLILLVALACSIVAFFIGLLKEPMYSARTVILFRSGEDNSMSGLAGLANFAGIHLPSKNGNQEDMLKLLRTKAVALKVLKDLKLRERIKGWDNLRITDHELASSVGQMLKNPKQKSNNLVELVVEYKDPQLTADVANAYARALTYYWNELNYSEVQKKREYIEKQLPRVERDLKTAENKIKKFTLLSPKGGYSMGSGTMGLVSVSQSQGIEIARLSRELEIQNAVYTMLRKEYETVKLEESTEIQPLVIVDKAIVPNKPFAPKIKLMTQIGFALGLFSGVFLAFAIEYIGKSRG